MRILFIITASIAIKKSVEVFKSLRSHNIKIDCIISDNAKKMINLTQLQNNISGKIYTNQSEKNNKMLHIKLTRKNDLVVVCPATANIIAKFANGYANDLASTSLIASNKQVVIIPAMNSEMWNNLINKNNVLKLKKIGVEFIGPEYGKLSCGETGIGRLSEIKKINQKLIILLHRTLIFKNKTCLITAGPTIEPIDSVRYLSNYSSGKQGFEIAKQMILSGARVILISGPTQLEAPFKTKLIKVKTAKEMYKEVMKNIKVDIAIFTAAVSDLSPVIFHNKKIKKENLNNIILKKNKDILASVSNLKKNRPKIIVGFAAETQNHILNAKQKLFDKKCNAIVVNKISNKNKVFGEEMNKVSFVTEDKILNLKKSSKTIIAKQIIQQINNIFI